MTGTLSFLVVLALLVGVWWLDHHRRRLAQRARAKGDQWGAEVAARGRAKHLPDALETFGRSVVVPGGRDEALALVDAVVRRKRQYAQAGPGTWHVDFSRPDDLVVSAVDGPDGTEVVLASAREQSGLPPAVAWTAFLGDVTKAARRGDVAVHERTGARYERRPVEGEAEQRWFPV